MRGDPLKTVSSPSDRGSSVEDGSKRHFLEKQHLKVLKLEEDNTSFAIRRPHVMRGTALIAKTRSVIPGVGFYL